MRTLCLLLVVAWGILSGQQKLSLYERVGRYDGIATIVDQP